MNRRYAINPGGSKRLEVRFPSLLDNVTVVLDGTIVGFIATEAELRDGASFDLPDGSRLWVKWGKWSPQSNLELLRNGSPIPGSATDPRHMVYVAWIAIFVLAAGDFLVVGDTLWPQAFMGGLVTVGKWELILSATLGTTFIALGLLVRSRSRTAAVFAFAITAAKVVYGVSFAIGSMELSSTAPAGPEGVNSLSVVHYVLYLLVQLAIIHAQYRGVRGINILRRNPPPTVEHYPPPSLPTPSSLPKIVGGLMFCFAAIGLVIFGFRSLKAGGPPLPDLSEHQIEIWRQLQQMHALPNLVVGGIHLLAGAYAFALKRQAQTLATLYAAATLVLIGTETWLYYQWVLPQSQAANIPHFADRFCAAQINDGLLLIPYAAVTLLTLRMKSSRDVCTH